MSATEVLRRLLDERGVEYEAEDEPSVGFHFTSWDADGFMWEADDRDEHIYLSADRLITPEQVIAATLGAGTCHVESSIIDTYEYNRWEYELSCGHTIIWEDSEPPNYCPICGRRIEQ